MPELPEVTTIVGELNRWVRGKTIREVEVRSPKLVRPLTVAQFRLRVKGKTFLGFERRAKYILARLGSHRGRRKAASGIRTPASGFLLWHMGMTGHPLHRNPEQETRNKKLAGAMRDPMNQHVRLTFHFTDGTRLEYTDIRLFGLVEYVRPEELEKHLRLEKLGPDALHITKRPAELCSLLRSRKKALKVALMDQTVISGVGNIYADEALWTARLHPLLPTQALTERQCRTLAQAIGTVLRTAIRARGTSIDDYRRLFGNKGRYADLRKAYQRTGLPCPRCGTLIRRLVVGGRGTHVCPRCQRAPSTK